MFYMKNVQHCRTKRITIHIHAIISVQRHCVTSLGNEIPDIFFSIKFLKRSLIVNFLLEYESWSRI